MTRNVGTLDRVLRIIVGLVLLAHVYNVTTAWADPHRDGVRGLLHCLSAPRPEHLRNGLSDT